MSESIFLVKVIVNFDYKKIEKEFRPEYVKDLEIVEKLILNTDVFKWDEDNVCKHKLYTSTQEKAIVAFQRMHDRSKNKPLDARVFIDSHTNQHWQAPLEHFHAATLPEFVKAYESTIDNKAKTIDSLIKDTEADWDAFTETLVVMEELYNKDVDMLVQGAILLSTTKDQLIEELDNEIHHLVKEHDELTLKVNTSIAAKNVRETLVQMLQEQNKDLKEKNKQLLAKQTQYIPNFVLVLLPE